MFMLEPLTFSNKNRKTINMSCLVLNGIFVLSTLFLFGFFLKNSEAAKILILPYNNGGHVNEAANIGRLLVEKDHKVYVLRSNALDNPKRLDGKGLQFVDYDAFRPNESLPHYDRSLAALAKSLHEVAAAMQDVITKECENTLLNETFMDHIKTYKFDLALIDGLHFCLFLIPFHLNIPFIMYGSFLFPTIHGFNLFEFGQTCDVRNHKTTSWSRYKHIQEVKLFDTVHIGMVKNPERFLIKTPFNSLFDVQRRAKLILHNSNHFVDCPKPKHPKIIQIGGFGIVKPKPIPEDYEIFYRGATDGVILFAFGSLISAIPDDLAMKFIQAFDGIKQRVVWQCILEVGSNITEFPENVMVKNWLPLVDLLADNRTKLLMYHGGNNGQMEAVYFGVPMITIPLFGDQHYNARRSEQKGYGLTLDIKNFTPEVLKSMIKRIVNDNTFAKRMKDIAIFFQYQYEKYNPSEKVANSIDELLRFGDENLFVNSDYLYEYQLYMWDFIIIGMGLLFFFFMSFLKLKAFLIGKIKVRKKVE